MTLQLETITKQTYFSYFKINGSTKKVEDVHINFEYRAMYIIFVYNYVVSSPTEVYE